MIASSKIWKEIAGGKIRLAEEALNEAEASRFKDYFTEEIEKAKILIDESMQLFADESYSDSCDKSEEAIEILNSVAIAMESKAEEMRLEQERKAEETVVKEREYIVKYNPKERDCLWRIALNVYNDAKLWPLIYIANRDQIKDPDLIFPGQKFKIPADDCRET